MKKIHSFFCIMAIAMLAMVSCNETPIENYSSMQDFISKGQIPMQTYTINGATGGTFTTPQGTIVSIPSFAFMDENTVPISGNITIQFKDLYKKSDMILCNITTIDNQGYPLWSGGEFFMEASYSGSSLYLNHFKKITVSQPRSLTGTADYIVMQPFSSQPGNSIAWVPSTDTITTNAEYYVYQIWQSNTAISNWFNSDNSIYFSAFPLTSLTFHSNDDPSLYETQAFLCFDNLTTIVHIYNTLGNFTYNYAPQGLTCTMVAFGIKDGHLYSSFQPITIGPNQTYHFSLNQTTTSEFKTQLEALN